MTAYLIADVDVTDPSHFEEYNRDVPATEARYGGKYLGRGGATKVLEGDWQPHRLVIVEFPDMDSLRRDMNRQNTPVSRRFVKAVRRQELLPLKGLRLQRHRKKSVDTDRLFVAAARRKSVLTSINLQSIDL